MQVHVIKYFKIMFKIYKSWKYLHNICELFNYFITIHVKKMFFIICAIFLIKYLF